MRKQKIQSLLAQNAVKIVFLKSFPGNINSIVQSLHSKISSIIRCAVSDEKNDNTFYVSFESKKMVQRAIKEVHSICSIKVEVTEYVAKEEPSPKPKPSPKPIDEKYLFLSENSDISWIIIFHSHDRIKSIDQNIRRQSIEGSGIRANRKNLYTYAVDTGDINGYEEFKNQYPKIFKFARFLEQSKMIINCPPGINKNHISSLFNVNPGSILFLFNPNFPGDITVVVRFNDLESSREFDSFMLERERSIRGHIIFAVNNIEIPCRIHRRVNNFILNHKDSFPVVIKPIPPGSEYSDIHDRCIFRDITDEDFRKKIKIRSISCRKEMNSDELICIVVYSTKEASNYAQKNINMFLGQKVNCTEYREAEIINETATRVTNITGATPSSSNNLLADQPFVWD